MNKKIDQDNIQYKILKSEACGHTIEYKMVKKEHELEKARIDEGKSPREKMKAREERSSKEREPRELNPDQYETGKKIARTKAVTETGEKQRKQTLKDVLHTHKKRGKDKLPSQEDLEYPMAASEEECKCEDKTEKCECEDKEMKKREKFYIQKIQELRKKQPSLPGFETPQERLMNNISKYRGQASDAFSGLKNRAIDAARGANSQMSLPGMETGKEKLMSTMRSIPGKVVDTVSKAPTAVRTGASALGNLTSKALPYAGKAAGIASALIPSQIGAGQNDPEQQFINEQHARSRAAKASPEATQNVANLLNNKQPATQAEPMMSMANQNMSMQGQAPAQTAAPKYDMKNPYKVENAKNFKDAFDQARKNTGGGGNVFEYGGKKYHTYTQDEFKNPEKAGIEPDNKFYKDWQARKDTTGPNAYYANKMNPAPAAAPTAPKNEMAPAESIKSTPSIPNIENAPNSKLGGQSDLGSTPLRPQQKPINNNQP